MSDLLHQKTAPAPPKFMIIAKDGSILTCGQANIVKVVKVGKRRLYQKNGRGEWFRWRGKRGWLRVNKTKRIEKLEAV